MAKILIVDDEVPVRMVLGRVLKMGKHDAVLCGSVPEALQQLGTQSFDLLVLDIKIGDMDGMAVLRAAHEEHSDTPVLMITGYATVSTAVEALKLGAFDYITKPFKIDELLCIISHALDYGQSIGGAPEHALDNSAVQDELGIIAASSSMASTCELIRRIAPTDAPLLICGERGTGKDLLANIIHKNSRREAGPFVTIDCAVENTEQLDEMINGCAEEAPNGGTVCFAEPQRADAEVQAHLLSVLEGETHTAWGSFPDMNMRVITTSTDDLRKSVLSNSFSPVLYAKLRSIDMMLKPLRDRTEDVLPLVTHVLHQELNGDGKAFKLAPDVTKMLKHYSWPGNVDELRDVVCRALITAGDGVIESKDMPREMVENAGTSGMTAEAEFHRAHNLKEYLSRSLGK